MLQNVARTVELFSEIRFQLSSNEALKALPGPFKSPKKGQVAGREGAKLKHFAFRPTFAGATQPYPYLPVSWLANRSAQTRTENHWRVGFVHSFSLPLSISPFCTSSCSLGDTLSRRPVMTMIYHCFFVAAAAADALR